MITRSFLRWASLGLGLLALAAAATEMHLRAQALAQTGLLRQSAAARVREIGRLRHLMGEFATDEMRASQARRTLEASAVDPEAQEARMQAALRGWARIRYGTLGRRLGLSPAQIAAFEQAAVDGENRLRDLRKAARLQNLPDNSPILRSQESAQRSETKKLEGQILGPDGAEALMDSDSSAEARSTVQGLAGGLYDQDPLTPSQINAAIGILVKISPQAQPDDQKRAESLTSLQSQLARVLSPTQLSSLMFQVRGDLAMSDVEARQAAALKTAGIADP